MDIPASGSPVTRRAGEAEREAVATVRGRTSGCWEPPTAGTRQINVLKLGSMRPASWRDMRNQEAKEQSVLNPDMQLNTHWKTQRRNGNGDEGDIPSFHLLDMRYRWDTHTKMP